MTNPTQLLIAAIVFITGLATSAQSTDSKTQSCATRMSEVSRLLRIKEFSENWTEIAAKNRWAVDFSKNSNDQIVVVFTRMDDHQVLMKGIGEVCLEGTSLVLGLTQIQTTSALPVMVRAFIGSERRVPVNSNRDFSQIKMNIAGGSYVFKSDDSYVLARASAKKQ